MPFSSVSSLPDFIKKLSPTIQRMWMHTFNSTWNSLTKKGVTGKDRESRSFRAANSTIKRRAEQNSADKYTNNTYFNILVEDYLGNLNG